MLPMSKYVSLCRLPVLTDNPPAAIIRRRRCTGKRINTAIVPEISNIPGSSRNHTMTKTMSYERGCHFAHVLLIADMLYARDGSGVYISVDSNGSECITWASLDVCDLLGIDTSRTSSTQNIEESLLWKVHAADPLHFTFPFLLVFQVFHLSFVMSWPTAPVSPEWVSCHVLRKQRTSRQPSGYISPQGRQRLTSNDSLSNCGLNGNLKHLPGNDLVCMAVTWIPYN